MISGRRGCPTPLPRPARQGVGSAPRSADTLRQRDASASARGADRVNPCESGSSPLRFGLEVLQPSLQPLANGPDRLRRGIGTSLFPRGEVVGQKGKQLEQSYAGIRDVVVRPLRRVNRNSCQQRIPELLEAADVEFRRWFRHGAILPQSRSPEPAARAPRALLLVDEGRNARSHGADDRTLRKAVRCLVIPRDCRAKESPLPSGVPRQVEGRLMRDSLAS